MLKGRKKSPCCMFGDVSMDLEKAISNRLFVYPF